MKIYNNLNMENRKIDKWINLLIKLIDIELAWVHFKTAYFSSCKEEQF